MKNFKKLSGISLRAGFISLALSLSAHTFAGTYTSTVQLPTLHSKNHVYTAPMPIPVGVGEGFIKNISWNWNVHGWPGGFKSICAKRPRVVSTFPDNELVQRLLSLSSIRRSRSFTSLNCLILVGCRWPVW
jgi:hypothetical protein